MFVDRRTCEYLMFMLVEVTHVEEGLTTMTDVRIMMTVEMTRQSSRGERLKVTAAMVAAMNCWCGLSRNYSRYENFRFSNNYRSECLPIFT